jgi:hypothetical protein
LPLGRYRLFGIALLIAVPAVSREGVAQPSRTASRPRLVVFFTVDQMRPDYLDRWARQLTGGLGRLSQRGAFFPNAYQDHADHRDRAGTREHAVRTLSALDGIVRNTAGVEDPQAPLLTSRDPGASPYRFRGSTLIDWMRSHDRAPARLSISRKDRGAILPLGRAKQSVFWYATSKRRVHDKPLLRRHAADVGPTRERAPRSAVARRPVVDAAAAGARVRRARRRATGERRPRVRVSARALGDPRRAASELPATPWMDRFTLDAGPRRATGPRSWPWSRRRTCWRSRCRPRTTWAIATVPDSREQHDNVLRLDRALGAFIDSLYKLRDSSHDRLRP